MAVKGRIPWETRLINEWRFEKFPDYPQWVRQRVGPIPGRAPDAYKGVKRGWVDLIIEVGRTIMLVEAKMKPTAAACGQLKEYERLFPLTPEFSKYANYNIKLILLTTKNEPVVEETCRDLGVEYEVFNPPWVKEYLRELALKGR